MDEILRGLPPGARVLDAGSGRGSFPEHLFPLRVVRADLERAAGARNFVQADAASLPFGGGVFDAVICNHSLEHFQDPDSVLEEIGRVLAPGGALFISVPDAGTLTDHIYRFLSAGGGHVNAFRSRAALSALVEERSGLPCRAVRTLFTSLSFLHPANRQGRRALRFLPLAWVGERTLRWTTFALRLADRFLHTRLGIYGWAFWFGRIEGPVDESPWSNACVRCGAAHPSAGLALDAASGGRGRLRTYQCRGCGTNNLWTDDTHYRGHG